MTGVSTTVTWDDLRPSPMSSTEQGTFRYVRRARHKIAYTLRIYKPKPKDDGSQASR